MAAFNSSEISVVRIQGWCSYLCVLRLFICKCFHLSVRSLWRTL